MTFPDAHSRSIGLFPSLRRFIPQRLGLDEMIARLVNTMNAGLAPASDSICPIEPSQGVEANTPLHIMGVSAQRLQVHVQGGSFEPDEDAIARLRHHLENSSFL